MKDNSQNRGNYESFLKSELKKFREDFDSYKKDTEEFIDSSNYLINTLFLDYELNQPTFLLNSIQQMSIELLNFVKNVCDKYDITWWLDFGGLLGARRHGGYIPWDDDIDIGMMREDYLNFDNIISKEIKNQGLDNLLEVRYRPFKPGISKFIQVFARGEVEISTFRYILGNVDIFPYEYIRDYDEKTIVGKYKDAKNKLFYRKEKHFNVNYVLDKYYEDLNLSWEPTDYIIQGWESPCTPGDVYRFVVFERDKIFPLEEINFAGNCYPCPNDANHHIGKIYSNYMKIPKNMRKHDRPKHFRYNKNNEEVFTECLNTLRQANINFE